MTTKYVLALRHPVAWQLQYCSNLQLGRLGEHKGRAILSFTVIAWFGVLMLAFAAVGWCFHSCSLFSSVLLGLDQLQQGAS